MSTKAKKSSRSKPSSPKTYTTPKGLVYHDVKPHSFVRITSTGKEVTGYRLSGTMKVGGELKTKSIIVREDVARMYGTPRVSTPKAKKAVVKRVRKSIEDEYEECELKCGMKANVRYLKADEAAAKKAAKKRAAKKAAAKSPSAAAPKTASAKKAKAKKETSAAVADVAEVKKAAKEAAGSLAAAKKVATPKVAKAVAVAQKAVKKVASDAADADKKVKKAKDAAAAVAPAKAKKAKKAKTPSPKAKTPSPKASAAKPKRQFKVKKAAKKM